LGVGGVKMGIFDKLFGGIIIIKCRRCGMQYVIGKDATVVTKENVAVMLRITEPRKSEGPAYMAAYETLVYAHTLDKDLVESCDWKALSKPLRRVQVKTIKELKRKIKEEPWRQWYCYNCGEVQPYSPISKETSG